MPVVVIQRCTESVHRLSALHIPVACLVPVAAFAAGCSQDITGIACLRGVCAWRAWHGCRVAKCVRQNLFHLAAVQSYTQPFQPKVGYLLADFSNSVPPVQPLCYHRQLSMLMQRIHAFACNASCTSWTCFTHVRKVVPQEAALMCAPVVSVCHGQCS